MSASTKITSVYGKDSIGEVDLDSNGDLDIGTDAVSIFPDNDIDSSFNIWSESGFGGLGATSDCSLTKDGPKCSLTVKYDASRIFGKGKNAKTIS